MKTKLFKNNKLTILLLFIVFSIILYLIFRKMYTVYEGMMNVEDFFQEFKWGYEESSDIPNTIWTFWDGPEPEVISMFRDSWKKYNPTYTINILTKKNVPEYLPEVDIESFPRAVQDGVQKYSDFVRVHILAKYGGIWADASVICHHPFSWIHSFQKKLNCEYVGYYIDGFTYPEYKSYSPVIENWFFACVPNSKFVSDWRDEFVKINKYKSADDYVEAVVKSGTNIQNIMGPGYLSMHVAAQKILQKNKDKYNLCLFMAEKSAFKYLKDTNFHTVLSIDLITDEKTCHEYYKYPFLKLRGGERMVLEGKPNKKNAFS